MWHVENKEQNDKSEPFLLVIILFVNRWKSPISNIGKNE